MLLVFIFCCLHLPGNNCEYLWQRRTMCNSKFSFFLYLIKHLFFSTGASDTKSVLQTPPDIIKRNGESVASGIKCSHKITNYDRILWYKQDEHRNLKLLGFLNVKFVNLEDDAKGKFNFDGLGSEKSSLSISDLALNDSAVYFCAASRHSAADSPHVSTKTLLYLPAIRTRRSDSWAPAALKILSTVSTQLWPRLRSSCRPTVQQHIAPVILGCAECNIWD